MLRNHAKARGPVRVRIFALEADDFRQVGIGFAVGQPDGRHAHRPVDVRFEAAHKFRRLVSRRSLHPDPVGGIAGHDRAQVVGLHCAVR